MKSHFLLISHIMLLHFTPKLNDAIL